MKTFMDDKFLLSNETAVELFETYAKNQPIFDYHCHLSAKEIYENVVFEDIAQMWLEGDHYKWRMMRGNGISEEYITGNASNYDKFMAYAKALPYAIGNPLYHWSHLELQRYFGIEEYLTPKTADTIWEKANKRIKENKLTPQMLIKESNVYALCTTEDPVDCLDYHEKIREEKLLETKILPAFRPDRVLTISDADYKNYIKELAKVSDREIESYEELQLALIKRMDDFEKAGCVASDHGFNEVPYERATKVELEAIFAKALNGDLISIEEENKFKTELMIFLGKEYHRRDWVMELHMGVIRNLSTRMHKSVGINTGFDSISDKEQAKNLGALLDAMDLTDECPKTVLFSLNFADKWVLASMTGNFMSDDIPGKIQLGTAWWFLDNKDGMEEQMRVLANSASLGRFIGMLTDSRSFLSYPRREYFRRILCNLIGTWVENGEYPKDEEYLQKIVEGICFKNAQKYLNV